MLRDLQRRFVREVERGDARLSIYSESLAAGLAEALADVYPVCGALVGDDFFDALALRFARETPSRSPDLNDYGEALPAFLERLEPARSLPYLPDVARLEWLCHRAFHAGDAADFDLEALGAIPAERHGSLVLCLAPSVGLIDSRYPISEIWSMHQGPRSEDTTLDLDAGSERCVVWRSGLEVRVEALSSFDSWILLTAFSQQVALEDVVGELDDPTTLGEALHEVIARGWVSGFREPG